MKDVDAFVDEHYDELIDEMKSQHYLPYYWEARIVSSCGVVLGGFREFDKEEWIRVIYNNGEWIPVNDFI